MNFGFLGINYKNASLEIRDKVSFTDTGKTTFFQNAELAGIDQCMILATCNRTEVYFFYDEEKQREKVKRIFVECFPQVDVAAYLIELQAESAMEYLFRVAAGLESLVLGEDQILGQVREALDFSRTMGYAKKELNRVVLDAITSAKKMKTALKISEKPISVAYVGIRKLMDTCPLEGKTVLIVGSGKTAALALRYVWECENVHVIACSRNMNHARELTSEFPGIEIISYDRRYEVMDFCDVVICATSSPHLVIVADKVCTDRKLCFLDLAAPRDVDPALSERTTVELINLDSIQETVQHNQQQRQALVEEASAMITEDLTETIQWLQAIRVDDTIGSLQQRIAEIVTDSYEYLNRKMDLEPREQKVLKKVLNASLQRLLREPIQELKQLQGQDKQDEYQRVVKQLFRIDN